MKILDRLPIPKDRTSLRFGDRYVTIHANQILVWVSIQQSEVLVPEVNVPIFPALLDTGNNFGSSVRDRHLREWAGIDPGLLDTIGHIMIEGKVVTRRDAAVWLCPNIPGRQDAASGRPPCRLDLSRGIAVYALKPEIEIFIKERGERRTPAVRQSILKLVRWSELVPQPSRSCSCH